MNLRFELHIELSTDRARKRRPQADAKAGRSKRLLLTTLQLLIPLGPIVKVLVPPFLAACAVGLLVAPAAAQPSLEVVGTWGGAVNTVFVDEAEPDIAYIGSGRRLVILDVADPANILELGSIDLGNLVFDMKVQDRYAYVGTFAAPNYLCAVDVSEPTNPRLVWSSGARTGAPRGLDLFGTWLYVRRGTDLQVYDISSPENPTGEGVGLWSKVHAFAIVGDKMYVGWDDRPSEFRIYELSSDPVHPTLLGAVTLPAPPFWAPAWDVTLAGNYAYVTQQRQGDDAPGGLAVIDVSDPESPLVVGTYSDVFNARGVAVAASHAFMADWTDTASPSEWERAKGLAIIDVAADPSNPTLVGAFKTHGTVTNVEIVGDRAYVMDDGEGLIILDISDPLEPVRLGNWHSPTELRKIGKVGDLLYITDQWNGVTILSVADPSRPALVGVYQSVERGVGIDHWGIDARGDFVHLAAGWNGFEVIDVSVPGAPQLAGAVRMLPDELYTRALTLSQNGDVAHVGLLKPAGPFFRNYEVSSPHAPSALGTVGGGGVPKGFSARDDGIVFVAQENSTGAVETSDPMFPIYLGSAPVWARDVAVDNDLLYIASDRTPQAGGGLYIQDVSDPANQVTLGYFPAFGQMTAVAIRNRVAYLLGPITSGEGVGLLLFDVSDPGVPGLLVETFVPGAQFDLLVDGRYAYVTAGADGNAVTGLTIVRLTGVSFPGDLNCDGQINAFDIEPFLVALFDPENYAMRYPDCDINNGDINGDGSIDAFDIEPFLELLFGP